MKYLKLIRIQQWYKNLVVFLALFFSANFLDWTLFYLTFLAFVSLSFISSAGYIINDFIDLKYDRFHPEKKFRPLAAGKINKITAGLFCVILLAAGFYIAYYINKEFLYMVILLFAITLAYTLLLKRIIFADILTIATLFVARAISGAVAIKVIISPWLVLVPFFLSLFLSAGKRYAELHLLKENAGITRPVLKEYNKEITESLMLIATTLLIISYALYSFLSEFNYLLYTLPFALFVIFRFYYLINKGSPIARCPETVVKDWPMMIGMLLWLLATAVLIYW